MYQRENVLAFLSRKNVLPKYGFPVDTVELSFASHGDDRRIGLQLQRDLSMAISEYAPGSQVVANGDLITSRYIRKLSGLNWRRFDYAFCPDCKTLNTRHSGLDDEVRGQWRCRACQKEFHEMPKTFLIPEFGFEADANKVERPGLTKPEHTYRGEIAYIGNPAEPEIQTLETGRARIELWMSHDDELAALNQSNFFVCEYCGFTELDDRDFGPFKRMQHRQPSGHPCVAGSKNALKRFSLGYVFRTDVLQIRFIDPCLREYEQALSVLHGLLRGISSYMNVELSDVAGCLQYVSSEGGESFYSLIIYDRTPGGSGYVRQMNSEKVMREVLEHSLSIMELCDCGGQVGDASCYTCLRSYANQRIHDLLKRCHVIDFLKKV